MKAEAFVDRSVVSAFNNIHTSGDSATLNAKNIQKRSAQQLRIGLSLSILLD